jgi:protein-S-isoprenylcysteine O-methyltransferase Ste14
MTVVSRMLPPRLFVILAMAGCLVGWLLPVHRWIDLPASLSGGVLVVAGLALSVAGSRIFDRVGANIKTFDAPTALVTDGLFARSRNPMYLGFTAALLGVAIVVGTVSALLGPVVFFLAAQLHYIPFEERRMAATFGPAYHEYTKRVRRWI